MFVVVVTPGWHTEIIKERRRFAPVQGLDWTMAVKPVIFLIIKFTRMVKIEGAFQSYLAITCLMVEDVGLSSGHVTNTNAPFF